MRRPLWWVVPRAASPHNSRGWNEVASARRVDGRRVYRRNGKSIDGPFTRTEMRDAALRGVISPEALVSQSRTGGWVLAKRIGGLQFRGGNEASPQPLRRSLESRRQPSSRSRRIWLVLGVAAAGVSTLAIAFASVSNERAGVDRREQPGDRFKPRAANDGAQARVRFAADETRDTPDQYATLAAEVDAAAMTAGLARGATYSASSRNRCTRRSTMSKLRFQKAGCVRSQPSVVCTASSVSQLPVAKRNRP